VIMCMYNFVHSWYSQCAQFVAVKMQAAQNLVVGLVFVLELEFLT